MLVIIWRFEVAAENRSQFEAIYGPKGGWAQLFGKSAGYLGTELLQYEEDARGYLTIDRWVSEEAFVTFRQQWAAEYDALDTACEPLTSAESCLGRFVAGSDAAPR